MVFSQATALVGLILNFAIAIYAFKRGWLDAGGTVAAIAVGMLVFSFGGWTWLALLVFFFASSNFFTHWREKEKKAAHKEFAKGGVRDFWQVMANGGIPALLAVVYNSYPSPAVFAAFLGVVATVTADTWATEVGVLEKKPRLITTLEPVRRGTSGAVSRTGIAVSFAAGLVVAFLVYALDWLTAFVGGAAFGVPARQFVGGRWLILLIGFVAVLGSLADSLFGATVQGIYYCPKCRKETEKRLHGCGTKTRLRKGFAVIDNDSVNFLSSIVGGAAAAGFYLLLHSIRLI
ncbi:DUF92 domain-containing protein [Candidatus Micrarchaeota archaeon]|nr:DUF92 domain-containing protein [Candidatus Micrarchaeota archaeon]